LEFDLTTFILLALILSLASIIQAAVGFGFALFALPLMLRLDIDLPTCIIISLVNQFWQQGINAYNMRKEVVLKPLIPLIASAWVFIAVGVYLQKTELMKLDQGSIRQVIGALVLLAVIVDAVWKVKHQESLHKFWAILAGAVGGLLSGLAGIPGPPIVIWVMSHTWSNKRSRVSLWVIFLALMPCVGILLVLNYGTILLEAVFPALCLIPFSIACSFIGVKIGNKLPKAVLRKIAMGILLVMALTAILKI
jgi:uncharacterized membrane protein YfcA